MENRLDACDHMDAFPGFIDIGGGKGVVGDNVREGTDTGIGFRQRRPRPYAIGIVAAHNSSRITTDNGCGFLDSGN